MNENCGISRWDNPRDINRQLEALNAQPVWEISDEYYNGTVLPYFEQKCKASKAVYEEARDHIPGCVQQESAFSTPFPVCFTKAEGARLRDKDGNEYLDFLQAGGTSILGNNHPAVRDKVIELLKDGIPVTGLLHESELLLAREINRQMPGVEMFRMLRSGTEAVMASLRAARIATGHKRVIKDSGDHGWSDQMVCGTRLPGICGLPLPGSHGIPWRLSSLTDEVRSNDLNMLERMLRLNQYRGGTAAVILEPCGPENGTRPVSKDYCKGARYLCDKYGALLIFDEAVTGFRISIHGAQGYLGVTPDLTIFGNIVAGGYPGAGGVGGLREYAGLMKTGTDSGRHRAYVGGILAAAPISALAGYTAIREIEQTNACEIAGRAGDKLTDGLKALIEQYGLPFVAYNQGSICHLECTGFTSSDDASFLIGRSALRLLRSREKIGERRDSRSRMEAACLANGLVTLSGSRLYTSLATTDEIIEEALRRFEEVFRHVVKTQKGL